MRLFESLAYSRMPDKDIFVIGHDLLLPWSAFAKWHGILLAGKSKVAAYLLSCIAGIAMATSEGCSEHFFRYTAFHIINFALV